MAIDRLESTLRALIGKRDPAELKATLSVRLDDDRTLNFSINIPEIFKDHNMSFMRPSLYKIGVNEFLSELNDFAEGIYPIGMDCRVVFGSSSEGLVMDAIRKYPELREHFGGSSSDEPASYELNQNVLSDINRPSQVRK